MKILAAMSMLSASLACQADTGEVRELPTVFADASVIVTGLVTGSQLASCNGELRAGTYDLKITHVLKGNIFNKDSVRICSPAPILLSNEYIIAGKVNEHGDLIFDADAAILFFPFDKYYRLIAYDSPYTESDRDKAYSIGIEEPDFSVRFDKLLNLKTTIEKREK